MTAVMTEDRGANRQAGCGAWLPETLEHFYRQRREDGNSRWATHCKPCERERALMTYYARREAAE